MAARKNRPVLYEVVRRTERQRERGWPRRWFSGREDPAGADDASPPTAEEASTSSPPSAPTVAAEDSLTPPLPAGPVVIQRRPIFFQTDSGRVHLTFDWATGSLTGIVLVVLLWGAYSVGRYSSSPTPAITPGNDTTQVEPLSTADGAAQTAAPRRGATEPGSITLPERPPARGSDESSAAAPREYRVARAEDVLTEGVYYVTAQYFPKSRLAQAEEAAIHLSQNDIPAALHVRARDIALIVVTPLSGPNDRAAQGIRTRLKAAGRTFDGYSFDKAEVRKY